MGAKSSVLVILLGLTIFTSCVASLTSSVKGDASFYTQINIDSNGTVTPKTAPINTSDKITYRFTGNIVGSLTVQKPGIVVDGNGFAIYGENQSAQRVTGIYISNVNKVSILNLIIANCSTGIILIGSESCSITHDSILNCTIGLDVAQSSDHVRINSNNFTYNMYGVKIFNSQNINFTNNFVSNNAYGITVKDSTQSEFLRNRVEQNNPVGISLISSEENSTKNSYLENNITSNGFGLEICNSSGNSLGYNNFINNTQPVLFCHSTIVPANKWDNGSQGNYWSNYVAIDTNGDGISDTADRLAENNIDGYPLMTTFPLVKPSIHVPFWSEWWVWSLAVGLTCVGVALGLGFARTKGRTHAVGIPLTESWTRRINKLLEEDANMRRKKIDDFERKYGVTIRRSEDTLEEILKRMGIEKKEE